MNISLSQEETFPNITEQNETTTGKAFMEEVNSMITFQIASIIAKYWIPVLVPIALVGNTLSFLVMIKPSNRKMSTCIYMAAISINDNMMMIFAAHHWLATNLKIYQMYDIHCKNADFWILMGLQNSTFQVIAMTFDKYIAIKWPHKAATYSTPRRAKITIIAVWVCVFIYNIPHFFFSKMIGDVCVAYGVGGVITMVYSWVTFSLNGLLAFTVLSYMNYVIIRNVRRSRKMFGNNEGQDQGQIQGNTAFSKREQNMKNTEKQLTFMLLLITTLFLILLFPTNARFVYGTFVTRDTPTKYASFMLFYSVSGNLYFTNNGINFFLYCMSGQKFHNDLKELLSCSQFLTHVDGNAKKDTSQSSITDFSTVN